MPHLQSRKWHQHVVSYMWMKNQKVSTRYTAVATPCFGEEDISILQRYTDEYMKKKAGLDGIQTEDRPKALIDSSKYWVHAFLSCVHLLSRDTTRYYLTDILQYVTTKDQ